MNYSVILLISVVIFVCTILKYNNKRGYLIEILMAIIVCASLMVNALTYNNCITEENRRFLLSILGVFFVIYLFIKVRDKIKQ